MIFPAARREVRPFDTDPVRDSGADFGPATADGEWEINGSTNPAANKYGQGPCLYLGSTGSKVQQPSACRRVLRQASTRRRKGGIGCGIPFSCWDRNSCCHVACSGRPDSRSDPLDSFPLSLSASQGPRTGELRIEIEVSG